MKNEQTQTVVTVTGEEAEKRSHKIEWIVTLRGLACMAVVLLHVVEVWLDNQIKYINLSSERQFLYKMVIPILTRFAVPAFIMISGCLLLDPKRKVGIDKIKKYLLKMLGILGTFGLAFCLIENIFNFGISNIAGLIYKSIFDLLQAKSWGHMWYIYMLIGLYMVTPILRKFVEHADDSTAKFTLWMLFMVSILIPTVNRIFKVKMTTFYLSSFTYIFMYLIGYYLVHTKNIIKDKFIYIAGILGFLGHVIVCFFGKSSSTNVFIVLETMMIVKLFSSGKIKVRNDKMMNFISKYSLGIYLVHPFWINIAYKGFGIYPNILPTGIGEIAFFAGIFILSVLTSVVLYSMPIMKKIL